jgi:hypothetical protein
MTAQRAPITDLAAVYDLLGLPTDGVSPGTAKVTTYWDRQHSPWWQRRSDDLELVAIEFDGERWEPTDLAAGGGTIVQGHGMALRRVR